MIDRLVAAGHVTREINPKDRRGVIVSPNPQSVTEAWKHISPLIVASEEALTKLKPAERLAIEGYLNSMLAVYNRTH
jgi:DNA-binding MarR family transcriptional regulator